MVFNFADFFAYLKALLSKGTLGFSVSDYPQTVQHFILESFPLSFYNFLIILAIVLCSIGVFLFFLAGKREMNSNFSKLSNFLRMNNKKIVKQARCAALPQQALFWSFFAPVIFVALLFLEAKFEFQGLGNTIKTSFYLGDNSLFYGSLTCAIAFIMVISVFFLIIRKILGNVQKFI